MKFIKVSIPIESSELLAIKYFTSRISGEVDRDAPRRQEPYLKALNSCREVEVVFGNFQSKTLTRPLVNLPIAEQEVRYGELQWTLPAGDYSFRTPRRGMRHMRISKILPSKSTLVKPPSSSPYHPLKVQVRSMEEKGSDVNLAVHLLNDAWRNIYDTAIVVSNDQDLIEAFRLVIEVVGKKVIVLCPTQNRRNRNVAPAIAKVASDVKYVRPANL